MFEKLTDLLLLRYILFLLAIHERFKLTQSLNINITENEIDFFFWGVIQPSTKCAGVEAKKKVLFVRRQRLRGFINKYFC